LLIELGAISEDTLTKTLAQQFGLPLLSPDRESAAATLIITATSNNNEEMPDDLRVTTPSQKNSPSTACASTVEVVIATEALRDAIWHDTELRSIGAVSTVISGRATFRDRHVPDGPSRRPRAISSPVVKHRRGFARFIRLGEHRHHAMDGP
jgi:hypothetical protein